MSKSLIGTLLIVMGIVISAFWLYPTWLDISALEIQKSAVKLTLERVKNLDAKRGDISAKFDSLSPEDKALLAEFFPRTPDSGVWLINIGNLASSNRVLLKGISMQEGEEENRAAPTENISEFQIFPFSISVSGSFGSLLSFMQALENSRRLIEIDGLTFDSGDGKKDFYEYTINAHTFWRK